MDETYASNVDNLNERLREYKQSQVDKASSLYNAAENKYGKMLSHYQDKWKAVQEGGQDEVTAQMGIKGLYNGAKKAFEVYKKYKGKKQGANEEDSDHEEDNDDGTQGGEQEDPQGQLLDKNNDSQPITEEDKEFLRDPMKEVRQTRQAIQDRMNSRLKELGLDKETQETVQSGNPSGSSQGNEPDLGTSTDDASQFQTEPTEESAFGDLSSIPQEGTAESVMWKLNAQAATERGGNIGQGGAARGQTSASDVTDPTTADKPAVSSTEGQPASGAATEGGNSQGLTQSNSSYDPEGAQGDADPVPKPNVKAPTKPSGDANPLDSDLPSELSDIAPEAAESGGFLSSLGVGEAATAAIPVVGEFLALFGGLFALGEGISHLAHPPADKTKPAQVNAALIPQSVQAKYASALPSFDSSSDNLNSDAVF